MAAGGDRQGGTPSVPAGKRGSAPPVPAGKPRSAKRPGRRESKSAKRARAAEIIARLHDEYPAAHCSLTHGDAYQLLTATILSAQCTDARVNMVTPALFRRYPTPADLAGARQEDVEELIRSTGFLRSKARSIIGMAGALTERHDGAVPRTLAELVELPGVGRKTANVVLGNAFGIDEGVVVDTHVKRLSGRLALSGHTDPEKIEADLMSLVERTEWTVLPHLFIDHGRAICKAPTPRCEACVLADLCPSSRV
jgi:endonuclease III